MIQPDLFARPLPAGLSSAHDLIDEAEEAALLAALQQVTVTPFRFQGWEGKRETASFGWRYDFRDGSFQRAQPIPDFLLPLRHKAATFAGLDPETLVQVLAVCYGPDAGIGWHRDRPVFDQVIGISLASAATLRFRLRRDGGGFDRASLPLAPRSIYHLTGDARRRWEHGILPSGALRWSITFRTLA